ncbi:MAG: GyrI-like domain-containing protein [Pseudomonadota bacterium]
MKFERKVLPDQHYLFAACACEMQGAAIASAMEKGFGQVFGYVSEAGITPLSAPIAVYHTMPAEGRITFECGVIVPAAAAAHVPAPVQAGKIAAGEAIMTVHTGAYATLNTTHAALGAHLLEANLSAGSPVWEVYIDDPGNTPEPDLRTEIYRALA